MTRSGSSPNPFITAAHEENLNITSVSELDVHEADTNNSPKPCDSNSGVKPSSSSPQWGLPWPFGRREWPPLKSADRTSFQLPTPDNSRKQPNPSNETANSSTATLMDDRTVTSRATVDRLKELRKLMEGHNLDYYVIPSEDAHQSEHIELSDKRLEYISGFSGSTGHAVVSKTAAYIIVDQYWLQLEAEKQLLDSNWELITVGTPADWVDWLVDRVKNSRIGVDARMISIGTASSLVPKLKGRSSKLVHPPQNLVDLIWMDRPPKSKAPIFVEPMGSAGKNALAKLNVLRDWLKVQPTMAKSYSKSPPAPERNSVATIITSLACIAYLLNLRGSDIPPSPLFRSYLFVGQDRAVLFINTTKVNQEVDDYLKSLGVDFREYKDFWDFLRQKEWGNEKILISPQTSYAVSLMLTKDRYIVTTSFISEMGSIDEKNEPENLRDTNGPHSELLPIEVGNPPLVPPFSPNRPQDRRYLVPGTNNGSNLLDLTGKILREGQYPSAHGGFADVWKCSWHDGSGERKVAVKVLRPRTSDLETEEKITRRLRRELGVWQRLHHENVLQLYGTTDDFGLYPSMVCPWLEKGNIRKLIEHSGDILTISDRLQIILDVAAGLSYLHSCSIVHGDLTGTNILITDAGKACLSDFGLSTVLVEFEGPTYFTSTIGGSIRWAAPELFRFQEDHTTVTVNTQTDMYSFGSVMLEILSGRAPYHYLKQDTEVLLYLNSGVKPRRPATSFVTKAQWEFIQQCWDDVPDKRPNIKKAIDCVKTLHNLYSSDEGSDNDGPLSLLSS